MLFFLILGTQVRKHSSCLKPSNTSGNGGICVGAKDLIKSYQLGGKKGVIFEIDARVQKTHKINEPSSHHQ
jgi:hypothetical protein